MAVVEIVQELKAVYANAANNKDVTFTFGIERIKTAVPIQNTVTGVTGMKPSDEDEEKFKELQKKFMKEVSYNKPHGTIRDIKGKYHNWRIDQQGNQVDLYNIQFQVDKNTFANVVVNTTIQPKPAKGEHINMQMEVFAQREGMKVNYKRVISTVYDVTELDSYREEASRINMEQRINKFVGEALTESFHKQLRYDINILLLKQN